MGGTASSADVGGAGVFWRRGSALWLRLFAVAGKAVASRGQQEQVCNASKKSPQQGVLGSGAVWEGPFSSPARLTWACHGVTSTTNQGLGLQAREKQLQSWASPCNGASWRQAIINWGFRGTRTLSLRPEHPFIVPFGVPQTTCSARRPQQGPQGDQTDEFRSAGSAGTCC